jgi:hypothetical protein
MRQAEASIRSDMRDTKILEDAEDNAATFLTDFYEQMGYEKVIVIHQKEEAKDE